MLELVCHALTITFTAVLVFLHHVTLVQHAHHAVRRLVLALLVLLESICQVETCSPCPSNTWTSAGTQTQCSSCSTCSSCDSTSGSCTACNSGFALFNGQCITCGAGQFYTSSTGKCSNCPSNTHSLSGVPTSCDKCSSCVSCVASSGLCTSCPAGTYLISSEGKCPACGSNKWSTNWFTNIMRRLFIMRFM